MSVLRKLAHPEMGQSFQLSLLCGVISSSYFFYGNLGTAFLGILPAIESSPQDSDDAKSHTGGVGNKFSVAQKAELWRWFYERGRVS